MTVATRSGRSLKLSFIHSSHNFDTRKDAGDNRIAVDNLAAAVNRRVTICTINELGDTKEQNVLIGEGLSMCHPSDTFDKAKGRKIALTNALVAASADGGLTREDRQDIWNVYRGV